MLPKELFQIVCEFLESKDLVNVHTTCKYFSTFHFNAEYLKYGGPYWHPEIINDSKISHCSLNRVKEIHCYKGISLLMDIPNLKTLKIKGTFPELSEELYSQIKRITIEDYEKSSCNDSILNKFINLEELIIYFTARVKLDLKLENLEYISVGYEPETEYSPYYQCASIKCKSYLEEFVARGCYVDIDNVKARKFTLVKCRGNYFPERRIDKIILRDCDYYLNTAASKYVDEHPECVLEK